TLEELLHGGKRRITLGGRSLHGTIPPGVRDGTALRLAGPGGKGAGGAPPRDLFLHLHLSPHPRYPVSGDDLPLGPPLWPWQAVLGAGVRIETRDGPVTLKVRPGTPAGCVMRLRGRGLPRTGGPRGDLHAVVRIEVPEQPSTAEREAYEALKRASGHA